MTSIQTIPELRWPNRKVKNISGQKFGRLTAIELLGVNQQGCWWKFSCECGKVKPISKSAVLSGGTVSCGCYMRDSKTKHRKYGTPEYGSWSSMKTRCSNPKHVAYHRYGGRGITVCERWMKFENFYADMGNRPSASHSLERLKGELGYFKENCVWATAETQANNTCSNRWIKFRGETLTLTKIAKKYGLKISTLRERLNRGYSVEGALTIPVSPYRYRAASTT